MAESVPPEREVADSVRLSYNGDEGTRDALETHSYTRYLQRSKTGPVTVGDTWAEFVNCGCGSTRDVTLRVEAIDGGSVLTQDTTITYEPRSQDGSTG